MAREGLVLIDTSLWIEALRVHGDRDAKERLRQLLLLDKAAWCEVVILELLNAMKGLTERKKIREYIEEVKILPINAEVWQKARGLVVRCREKGFTVPVTDILIAACGLHHGVPIAHRDRHFEIIFKEVL
jgi:predicted nucleic acid-binding protein